MSLRLARMPFLRLLTHRLPSPVLPLVRQSALNHTSRPRLFSTSPRRMSLSSRRSHASSSSSSFSSSSSSSSSSQSNLPPNSSLSGRLKHLIKTYGWYALGVYQVISILDFSLSFAAVNLVGAEYASQLAATAKAHIAALYTPNSPHPEPKREEVDSVAESVSEGGNEGLYAMLVLAFTIHKLFMPMRVALTAGLTPNLVRWLRQRGWAGGAGTKRAVEEMKEKMKRPPRGTA